jgi:hypothetical protein
MTGFNWGDALNAAMQLYMYQDQKKRADRDPTFIQVPPTPEETWRFDKTKELFNYSPTRDYMGTFANSFLTGMNGMTKAPDFGFVSPALKGQKPFGGMQMPDFAGALANAPQSWTKQYADQQQADAAAKRAVEPAPPIPPSIDEASRKDRRGQTARNLLGFFGINGGEDSDVKRERENRAAYQEWMKQYGSAFTDAAGNPVPAPKNLAEYKKWYEQKYGRPYQG